MTCSSDNDKNQRGTGLIDPLEVSKRHNQHLLQAIEKSTKNNKLSKRSIFMDLDIEILTDEQKEEILDSVSSVTPEQMKQITFSNLNNSLARDYYNQVDFALENSENLQELNESIDNVVELVNNDLVKTDWDVVMIYAETIRASAKFWFPENKGGQGKGYSYIVSKTSNKRGKQASSLRHVAEWVKKDGRAAGYASVTWAVGAALAGGPVAPVTYFAAVIGSALWGSFG